MQPSTHWPDIAIGHILVAKGHQGHQSKGGIIIGYLEETVPNAWGHTATVNMTTDDESGAAYPVGPELPRSLRDVARLADQRDVLGHDADALGVDRGQLDVLKDADLHRDRRQQQL